MKGLTTAKQILMPGLCFCPRQFGASQNLRELAPEANLLLLCSQSGDRGTISEKDKGHILIVNPVNAIGEVARGFGNADRLFIHKIRL